MRLKHTRGKKMIQMRGGGEGGTVQQLQRMIANGKKRRICRCREALGTTAAGSRGEGFIEQATLPEVIAVLHARLLAWGSWSTAHQLGSLRTIAA